MDMETQLQDGLKRLARDLQHDYLTLATIKEVNGDERTCIAIDELGIELYDVRLQSETLESGIIRYPTEGASALLAHIGNNVYYILLCSSFEKIEILKGEFSVIVNEEGLQVKASAIKFNDGENGGLINIADLVSKMNSLEQDLNSLKQAFSSWTPVPQDGGAALKLASASWAGQILEETTVEGIEDDKITH